jgi:hypothetical protein
MHNAYHNRNVFVIVNCIDTNTKCRDLSFGRENVRECADEDSHSQVSSHFGNWSPNGLPNLQKAITGVKTPRIEIFFISLESYSSVDV